MLPTPIVVDHGLGQPLVLVEGVARPRKAHLIGIAGAGMQALATVLAARGWQISGSDLAPLDATSLPSNDVRIFVGHNASQVPRDAELVIYSNAVEADCCERRRATELGIESLSYPQMLGRLTTGSRSLAVCGTHGKSTTTAMAAEILIGAGLDPTVVAGGVPLDRPTSGRTGRNNLLLVEACEYRANFLNLRPRGAALLGIEPDHFDCFDSPYELEAAFQQFVELLPPDGFIVSRADCPTSQRVTAQLHCRVESFGVEDDVPESPPSWQAVDLQHARGRYSFNLMYRGSRICRVALEVPGRHNVLNALAAGALAWNSGAGPEEICRGLESFRGLKRRLESIGTVDGVVVLDDYAHHPTEIRSTLAAVRLMYPEKRIWCIFQPHQVSRTRRLLDEFAQSLHNADAVLVADIYRAREGRAIPGEVTAADLAERVNLLAGRATVGWHSMDAILDHLLVAVAPGDVVITLGAGDIRKVSDGFADRLRADCAAR